VVEVVDSPCAGKAPIVAEEEMDKKLYNKLLARIPLFRNLNPEELKQIVQISKLVKINSGVKVITEGQVGTAMYMLVDGAAKVVKEIPGAEEAETKLVDISAPTVFGEMALIDGGLRSASVITTSECVLFRVDLKTFNQLRAAFHPAAFKLLRQLAFTLCERMDEKTARLEEFFKDPERNLANLEDMFLSRTLGGGK